MVPFFLSITPAIKDASSRLHKRMDRALSFALLGAALALSPSCQSFDADVFDASLREETFDALLGAIRDCYGDESEVRELTTELDVEFRNRALRSEGQSEYYLVLSELLDAIEDPHISASWSPTHAFRPQARPYRLIYRRFHDGHYVSYPKSHERLPNLGGLSLNEIDSLRTQPEAPPWVWVSQPEVLPELLQSFDDSPQVWRRLVSIGGRPVSMSSTLDLLVHGPLMSRVDLEVEHPEYGIIPVPLLRNCMRGEDFGLNAALMNRNQFAQSLQDSRWWNSSSSTTPTKPIRWKKARRVSSQGRSEWVPNAFDARVIGTLGYLRIETFAVGNDEDRLNQAYLDNIRDDLEEIFWLMRQVDSMIVDLRGNPGGWGLGMVAVASYFLDETPTVPFVATYADPWSFLGLRFENRQRIQLLRDPVTPVPSIEICVLVDQSTASAGEVLASILRSKRGARLVGERTRGAEYMVREIRLPDGSRVTLGTGGGMVDGCESFQGIGLEPDIRIDLDFEEVELHGLARAKNAMDTRLLIAALETLGHDPSLFLRSIW